MSAPNDEGNPWISLADLLQKKITVAILATVIETSGIQTYDRFGRRILATDDNAESKVSKARALDLLASYYTEKLEAEEGPPYYPESDPDRWFEYYSPLHEFGWPTDEAPDFGKIPAEAVPNSLKNKKHNIDAPVETRTRRTYLTIIAALCKECNIDDQARGASQRIKVATEAIGAPVDDGTIQKILKEIPDALESRSK